MSWQHPDKNGGSYMGTPGETAAASIRVCDPVVYSTETGVSQFNGVNGSVVDKDESRAQAVSH
jgi:hypothetical protein